MNYQPIKLAANQIISDGQQARQMAEKADLLEAARKLHRAELDRALEELAVAQADLPRTVYEWWLAKASGTAHHTEKATREKLVRGEQLQSIVTQLEAQTTPLSEELDRQLALMGAIPDMGLSLDRITQGRNLLWEIAALEERPDDVRQIGIVEALCVKLGIEPNLIGEAA